MRTLPHQVISLIHYVELNNSGWWEKTVDRCVMGVLWLSKAPIEVNKIRKETFAQLDLNLKATEIRRSLERLISEDKVIDLRDGRYKLSVDCEAFLSKKVEDAKQLETKVKEKFLQQVNAVYPIRKRKIWESFTEKFLVPLITDSGARVYEFFFTNKQHSNWLAFAEQFLEDIPESYREKVGQAIYEFVDPNDVDVSRFILTYLDAYFVISSSGLSPKVVKKLNEMRQNPAEFVIFVDTNFVYSILGLHDNPSNEAANDLMELIKEGIDGLKTEFVISSITLEETKKSLAQKRNFLGNIDYPSNLAGAATKADISGIYRSFFERVNKSGGSINPQDYFSIYEKNLNRILEEKGIKAYPDEKITRYSSYPEVITDISNQVSYEVEKYGNRAKSEPKISSDVILWHFVRDQRRDINVLPLDAKYWIVTVDYRFLEFDKFKIINSSIAPVCMLPAQLIQVIRFFIPRSVNFEKMMLSTMRFPLAVRDYDPGTERIALRIIKQLARFEGIEDLSVEMIQKVIMDEGLNLKLAETRHSEVEETELIHDVLLRQLSGYEEKLDVYKQKIEQKEIALGESEQTRQENEQQMSKDIMFLKEKVIQLENDKRTEQENKKKADAINAYKKLCALIILPFLFLLAIMWYSVILLVRPLVLSYSISALVSLVVSILITRFLLQAGRRDPYVLKTDFFQSVNKKLTLTVIISFLLSSIWSIAIELIAQILISKK